MRSFTFFLKAILFFAGILLLSVKNASADCPTNANTIFTTQNESCFQANDGIINVQLTDGDPIDGISVLFEPLRIEILIAGLDFTVTKLDDFNYRLSNVKPGRYFVVAVCDGGVETVNLGSPLDITNPNPRIVAAPSVLPTALPASSIACQSFTANWTDVAAAEGFLVDVALDNTFTNILPGFNNLDVGKTTSLNVPGLVEGTTYYYRVKGYRESCPPQVSATITATTPPAPVIFDITSPDSDICEDGSFSILLNGSETGVNYEVFIDGAASGIVVAGTGAALPVGPVAGLAPNATYVLTIVATTGENCTREMNGSVNLLVNPLPVVSIDDPGGPFCANEGDVTLTGLPAGGTWSGDGIDSNTGVFSPSALLPGDYIITYTYTDGNGCENSAQVSITINPVPDPTITAAGPFCEDAEAENLTAATAGGSWSGPGITDAAAGTFNPTVAGVGVHTIEYTVTNAEGCSETGTINITVNPLPDATITAAGPFCRNDAVVTLLAATAGGTWSGPGITDASAGTFDPATAGAGTHTINYTVTSGDGCTASDEIQILVNELPDVNIAAAGPFCLDAVAVNLSAATPGGTWSGPGITDAANGTFSASTAGIGTHIIEYTVTNAEGCTDTGQLEIIVNELPDASITAVGPFCLNDAAVTLTAATAGGIWSGPGITDAAAGTFDPSVAGVGIHEITYNLISPEGCEDADQILITVNDIPDATITAIGPFCVDEAAVNLTAATPGGTWSGDGITNAALGTFDPSVAGPGTHTITYTVSNAEGCENIATIDIVVNDLPNATITAAGPFCEDADAVTLTAATAAGTWSGPGITDAAAGTFNPTVAGVGVHTIEYTVTNAEGCSDTGTIDITVNPLPDATITAAGPFCVDAAAVNLTAATAGGNWSGPGITDASAGTFDPSAAGAGIHSITYTLTSGDGCIASDEIQIVVNELPDVSIDAAGPFCLDAVAVNLSAATPGGSWSGPGITDAVNGTFSASSAGVGTHIIEYTVTNAEGCTDTGQIEIIVNPLPDASITAAGPFCLNDAAVTLTAATAGGIWSGPGITDAAAGTFDPSVAGVGVHEITYTVSNADACESSDQIFITVNDIPDATITAIGPFCVDEAAVNLTAATPGGSWSGDGITNAALGTFDPSVAGPGTHTITYTVSNAEGCENIATIDIVVNDLPNATITAAGPFCEDADAVTLTAATAGGTWSGPGITDAAAGTFDPTVAGVGVHTIEYTVTNAEGCSDTGTIDITVNPLPDATITAAGPFCVDAAAVNLTAATAGGNWSGPGITDASAGTFDPSAAGAGIHSITYTLTSGDGCIASDEIQIVVNELPDVSITAAGPFCLDAVAVNLSAATPGGSWSGPGITDAVNGTFSASSAGVGTHIIEYTVTNAEGCTDIGQIEITVNPSPDASIDPVAPVCVNIAPFNLISSTTGGTWSGPGITDAGNGLFDPALAGPGDHVIRYELSVGGCDSSDEITITVLPVADVVISPAGPFCENDGAFTLSASESGGIWSGPGIIDAGTGLFDPGVAGIGTHIVQYIFTNLNGCESEAQISIVVNEVPEVSITPVAPLCASDASIDLSANVPGGTWSGPGITDNANGVFNPMVAGPGIHTILYELTAVNGCTALAEIEIDVRENPDVEIQPAGPFCLDTGPVNLQVNLPGGTWSGNGITDATNGVFEPAAAGAGVHRLIYTLEVDGCQGADTIDIIVNEVPLLLITQPEAICQPGVVDLTDPQITSGSSAGTLSYWTDAAATAPIADPSSVTAGGTYFIKLSSAEGCETTASVVVNILSRPVTSAISGETNPLCEAEGIVYSVNPAPTSDFQWSFQGLDGSSIAAGQGTSAIAVNFGNVNGLLQVVQTGANGCVAEAVSIPISLQGCALNANFIASPEAVCIGEEVIFSDLSGGEPVSWDWEFGEDANPATFSGQNPPAVVYSSSGTKSVRLVVSDGSINSEIIREINVKVSPAAIISGVSGICPGEETELTIEISGTPGPYTVVYTDGTDNFTLNNIGSPHIVNVSPVVSTTYTLVSVLDLSIANGCNATDFGPGVVIEILTPPDAPQNPVDNVFCAGTDPTVISVDDPGAGFTVNWFDAPIDGDQLASGQVSFVPASAGVYYAEVTDLNGCTSSSRTAVELSELDPPVTGAINGNATPDCGEVNVLFSVELRAGSNYVWTVPNEAEIISGQGTQEIVVNFGNRNGLVSVQETDENGCIGEIVSLPVSLQNCPLIPDIELSTNVVCLGASLTVSSNSVGVIPGTTEFVWDFGPMRFSIQQI
jgi:large repetitive protein